MGGRVGNRRRSNHSLDEQEQDKWEDQEERDVHSVALNLHRNKGMGSGAAVGWDRAP